MPIPVLHRDDKGYKYFLDSSSSFPESAGIVVNTFGSLEARAVKTLSEGLCVPNKRTPPIYCIGPLIATEGPKDDAGTRNGTTLECLTWLDSQPVGSVVFLCFGRLGLFSKEQLREIAFGLERSGHRFLWVVRNPPSDNKSVALSAHPNIDLDSLLPEGFLDRTKERGLVLKSWAPQVAVLNHPSVGGFVSHCGWNSVLEAVCAGVPLVAWPLYAEQRINRILLVEEMKLALPMNESDNGFVSSAEVEERVLGLMESEEGKLIRERAIAMKIAAQAALNEGGKLLLTQKPSLSIHILITTVPYDSGSTAPYIANVAATIPPIKFHHLPTVTLPSTKTTHHEELTFEVLRLRNPHVREELLSIAKNYTIHGLVVDFFCCAALSVAKELNIPGYHFSSSGAGVLAVFHYFPTIHNTTTKSLKDLKSLLHIPGVPPIPSSDMPIPVLHRDDKSYENFLDSSRSFPESAGIVVNTFESLEARAVKTLSEGLCVPNNRTPPIYCIGPLIATAGPKDDAGTRNGTTLECLTWLDSQPVGSVVFLCFGSLGLFSKEQLREIAFGLDRSGHRFLWVVRNPPSDNKSVALSANPNIDLDSLLPEGFLDRTKERGLVLKSWAPQVAVLNHPSVGGFVSHCGWNSVLEAVCAGVPLVAWPLYAEQRINRILLVEEMKLALPMNESDKGFVSSAEVEERVLGLMESEEGKLIRERAIAMKIAAQAALNEGGSSRVALSQLVESWKDK
ncbi:hypothetical protein NC651_010594 [Populus alba x Populus x berolinensis]|nr:hypothetical protein NC651_010594 [Populus alba x Populus x berolinensis]